MSFFVGDNVVVIRPRDIYSNYGDGDVGQIIRIQPITETDSSETCGHERYFLSDDKDGWYFYEEELVSIALDLSGIEALI